MPNKTNGVWKLRPVIDGEHWSGAETLTVEPQQVRGYELIYTPTSMTTTEKHMVSVTGSATHTWGCRSEERVLSVFQFGWAQRWKPT